MNRVTRKQNEDSKYYVVSYVNYAVLRCCLFVLTDIIHPRDNVCQLFSASIP